MNSYCDSEYYLEEYGGTLVPQDKVDTWLTLASNKIRCCILHRDITGYEELVKNCTCNVAELLYSQNTKRTQSMEDGPIVSESVGDYSRSFGSTSADETRRNNELALYDVMELYLGCTGLLYRGLNV